MAKSLRSQDIGDSRRAPGAGLAASETTAGHSYFEVYRTERVSFTSILFSGDDWRWCLRSADGAVLVNSEGYPSEPECRSAVALLQREAGGAVLAPLSSGLDGCRRVT